jgi:hypothetical protein
LALIFVLKSESLAGWRVAGVLVFHNKKAYTVIIREF